MFEHIFTERNIYGKVLFYIFVLFFHVESTPIRLYHLLYDILYVHNTHCRPFKYLINA